jgi:ABC-type Fe3+/spermidine/putrescine transport system ATPase subunit
VTEANGTLYELRAASRVFRRGDATIAAVDSVDLAIPAGGFVALEGPSGSGKTTLLQLLGALDRSTSGTVFYDGRDLGALRDHDLAELRLRAFGFVFQQFNLIPTLTALENVEADWRPSEWSGSSSGGARCRCSRRSGRPGHKGKERNPHRIVGRRQGSGCLVDTERIRRRAGYLLRQRQLGLLERLRGSRGLMPRPAAPRSRVARSRRARAARARSSERAIPRVRTA